MPTPSILKAKRFRRTENEIKLGLTIEEAMAARRNPQLLEKAREAKAVEARKADKNKAIRFRRTKAEIEAGLTIEQAAAARGVSLPNKPKKIYVERKVDAKPLPSSDMISTLSPRIQARANVMMTMRRRGVQGEITTEMLDLAAAAVAAGKVTKCPTGIDSDGYDHFNQVETR